MTDDSSSVFSSIRRALESDQARARDTLVPPAFQILWEVARFIVLYGGRSAAKSWSIARVLLVLGHDGPLRVLCCREIQGSIRESAYRLLADQIVMLGLDDFYEVQADRIIGKNGTVFYFEGLRYNASKIRSYEGVDIVWCEEAQSISELSWETLLPTIRKPGSRFFISFNPMTKGDPVALRFVENTPPGCLVKKVSYRDNPYFSAEAEAERQWLEKTDPDAYRHVWEGFPREVSDALILRGKYVAESFEVSPLWAGPYHGLDYGFARDPSAGVRCYIDDATRTLYVDREFWALGADIDALPASLENSIPGISRHTVYADSARPESTSYLQRNGIPGCRSAEKWPGSVDDGIAYLRAFERIVIDPSCRHLLDECGTYSFKQDRLTGAPLPEVLDANNHCIDALRYALSPLIRNKAGNGTYFARAALLVKGEPLALPPAEGRPTNVAVIAAVTEQPGSALAMVCVAWNNRHGWPLIILDWDVIEFSDLNESVLIETFNRAQELRELTGASNAITPIIAEGPLFNALSTVAARLITPRTPWNITALDQKELPLTLDERAAAVREFVNLGTSVKLAHPAYTKQSAFRAVIGNHFLTQVLGYKPGNNDGERSLLSAFVTACYGCLIDAPRQRNAEAIEAPLITHNTHAAEMRALHIALYEDAFAKWKEREREAVAAIRTKLGNPNWRPRHWSQLDIGPPPENPTAGIRLSGTQANALIEQ